MISDHDPSLSNLGSLNYYVNMRIIGKRRPVSHASCCASTCLCDDGRNFSEEDTIFQLITCHSCNVARVHIHCGSLKASNPQFLCKLCQLKLPTNSFKPRNLRSGPNVENKNPKTLGPIVKKPVKSKIIKQDLIHKKERPTTSTKTTENLPCCEYEQYGKLKRTPYVLLSDKVTFTDKQKEPLPAKNGRLRCDRKDLRKFSFHSSRKCVKVTNKKKRVIKLQHPECPVIIRDLAEFVKETVAENNRDTGSKKTTLIKSNASNLNCQSASAEKNIEKSNKTRSNAETSITLRSNNEKSNTTRSNIKASITARSDTETSIKTKSNTSDSPIKLPSVPHNPQTKNFSVFLFNINSNVKLVRKEDKGHFHLRFNKYLISRAKFTRLKKKRRKYLFKKFVLFQAQLNVLNTEIKGFADRKLYLQSYVRFFLHLNFATKFVSSRKELVLPCKKPSTRNINVDKEKELFYLICPQRPTNLIQGGRCQSSGRLGDKKVITRRILISMQKLGRSPFIDRPLSFRSLTFDGSMLFKDKASKSASLLNKNDTQKIHKNMKIIHKKSLVFKKRDQIMTSSKLNSRIKTKISKNGKVQMTVRQNSSQEDDQSNITFSKYFKIRRRPQTFENTETKDLTMSMSINAQKSSPILTKIEQNSNCNIAKSRSKKISPLKLRIKYRNMYGRVIEYAKELPRNL